MLRARPADWLRTVAVRLMLARYLLVSLCALSIDTMFFLALSRWVMPAGWAALAGYGLGIVIHWLLSVRFVFAEQIGGRPTHGQRAGFLLSAGLGLAVTTGTVSTLAHFGSPALPAKMAAVLLSFTLVYLVRKYVVFARS